MVSNNDFLAEMEAYDYIGMEFFYQGVSLSLSHTQDIEAATYYHDRMIRGKCEDKASNVRKQARKKMRERFEKITINRPPQPNAFIKFSPTALSVRPLAHSLSSTSRPCSIVLRGQSRDRNH